MPPEGAAVVLVSPASTAEISTVVRVARDHGLPVVAQGALTGLAGGANAVEGAGLLNLSRMNAVLRLERSTPLQQHAALQRQNRSQEPKSGSIW